MQPWSGFAQIWIKDEIEHANLQGWFQIQAGTKSDNIKFHWESVVLGKHTHILS